MSAQVAADLRAAADVLERDGWTQNVNQSANGCRCLLGALSFVVSGGATSSDWQLQDSPLRPRLRAAEYEVEDIVGISLTGWNDEPGRTADEVIAALRAAADRAEADQ